MQHQQQQQQQVPDVDSDDDAFVLMSFHSDQRADRYHARQRVRDDINTWHRIYGTALVFTRAAERWMRLAHTAPHVRTFATTLPTELEYKHRQHAHIASLHATIDDCAKCPKTFRILLNAQRDVCIELAHLAAQRRDMTHRWRTTFMTQQTRDAIEADASRAYTFEYGCMPDGTDVSDASKRAIDECVGACTASTERLLQLRQLMQPPVGPINEQQRLQFCNRRRSALLETSSRVLAVLKAVLASGYPVMGNLTRDRDRFVYDWLQLWRTMPHVMDRKPAFVWRPIDAFLRSLEPRIIECEDALSSARMRLLANSSLVLALPSLSDLVRASESIERRNDCDLGDVDFRTSIQNRIDACVRDRIEVEQHSNRVLLGTHLAITRVEPADFDAWSQRYVELMKIELDETHKTIAILERMLEQQKAVVAARQRELDALQALAVGDETRKSRLQALYDACMNDPPDTNSIAFPINLYEMLGTARVAHKPLVDDATAALHRCRDVVARPMEQFVAHEWFPLHERVQKASIDSGCVQRAEHAPTDGLLGVLHALYRDQSTCGSALRNTIRDRGKRLLDSQRDSCAPLPPIDLTCFRDVATRYGRVESIVETSPGPLATAENIMMAHVQVGHLTCTIDCIALVALG